MSGETGEPCGLANLACSKTHVPHPPRLLGLGEVTPRGGLVGAVTPAPALPLLSLTPAPIHTRWPVHVLLESTGNFLPGSLFSVYKDRGHHQLQVPAEDPPVTEGPSGGWEVSPVSCLMTSARFWFWAQTLFWT